MGYKIKEEAMAKKDWHEKLIWSKHCLLKGRVFAWLAVLKRILIKDRLQKMGIKGARRCVMC